MSEIFSCVRVNKIASLSELSRAASHGRRLDPAAIGRVNKDRTESNVLFSRYSPEDPLDLVGAWRAALRERRASPYGKAPIAAHLLISVSPQVIDEAGDRHKPDNPMNLTLVREAIAWAEDVFGEGSVFAGRLDLDEFGGGVVDVLIMPVRDTKMNARCRKMVVSIDKPFVENQQLHGEATSYGALQTSWANWAQQTVDRRIIRGRSKAETRREHVHTDVYRYVAASVRIDLQKEYSEQLDHQLTALENERESFANGLAVLEKQRQEIIDYGHELSDWHDEVEKREVGLQGEIDELLGSKVAALRKTVQAFLDGKIMQIDCVNGRNVPVLNPELSVEQRQSLIEAIQRSWRVGAKEILLALSNGNGRVEPPLARTPTR